MIENDESTAIVLNNNTGSWENLKERYQAVRNFSFKLCETLQTEDFVIQSMPDVSPTKWHLAHTSWFFETFVLRKGMKSYKSLNEKYAYLFNSYYVQAGERFYRPSRGLLSRPTVKEVFEYRKYIDENMLEFFEHAGEKIIEEYAPVIEIGINHEQQHQELLLTDIKHVFSINPLKPVYREVKSPTEVILPKLDWIEFDEGIYETGFDGNGFCYDNEMPRHKEFIQPFKLANRLITNGEFLEFIEDGGYKKAELWLSDGIAASEREGWNAPMYWEKKDGEWYIFKLNGFHKLNLNEPVCHVSHFEADAFARWKDARLPTEAEWEAASMGLPAEGNFVENEVYHTSPLNNKLGSKIKLHQMFGDVWEWTQSAYLPYPGYKTLPGALGEYNGKFMSGQIVLRGGSCATSQTHIRKTYRNFFYPQSRWQFMGIRLAKDMD